MIGNRKRVLIIAYAFPPHSVVGSMRPLRMAKYLREYSHWEPTIITVKKKFERKDPSLLAEVPKDISVYRIPTMEPVDLLENLGKKLFGHRKPRHLAGTLSAPKKPLLAVSNDRIRCFAKRIKSFLLDLVSTPDYAVFWNLFVIFGAIKIIRRERIDVIFVTSPPWSSQISGYILKKILRIPWVADFRDPWTDIKRGSKRVCFEKFEQWLEKRLLLRVDRIISTSETYTIAFRKKYPLIRNDKFSTLLNGFDEFKFERLANGNFEKFTIAHLGSLYSMFKPYLFFEALRDWLYLNDEVRGNVQVVFVGELDETTKDIMRCFDLDDIVQVTGFLPHSEALNICSYSDLLLLAMGTNPSTPKGWLPSKLFEYIGLDRPILANVVEGEAAKLIRNTKSGYVVTSDDKKAIVEVLDKLYRLKQNSNEDKVPWENDTKHVESIKQRVIMNHLGSILDEVLLKENGN